MPRIKKTDNEKETKELSNQTSAKSAKSVQKKSKTKKTESKAGKTTAKKSTSKKKVAVNPIKSILSRRRKSKVEINEKKKDTQEKNITADSSDEIRVLDKNDDSENLVINSNILEYYDLPYRYNETIVKILAQTPSILFVYWDISDNDKDNFINKYGENFFEKTRPVLLVHNKTKNYTFEVEINDFANSWYLRMQEPDCEYEIELGRRNIEDSAKYIYITSSNSLISPNDHVLFEESNFEHVKFKNVKTGTVSEKNYGSMGLMTNIADIYHEKHKVFRFYNELYKDEVLESKKMFSNPSSGNPTSGMFKQQ